jgi:hypothetical protein
MRGRWSCPSEWLPPTPSSTPEEPAKIAAVHVHLTRVKNADQPIENASIVAEEMVRWLRDIEGFEGFLMLAREGTTIGLSFWESRDVAARHRVARMQFIERMTSIAGVEIEEMVDFEVAFAELPARLTNSSG